MYVQLEVFCATIKPSKIYVNFTVSSPKYTTQYVPINQCEIPNNKNISKLINTFENTFFK